MMNRFASLLVVGSVFSALSACSLFSQQKNGALRDRDQDYLRSSVTAPIEVPDGVHSPTLEPLYPVPEVEATDEFGDELQLVNYDVPRPQPINSDENALGVKIQRLAGERWLFLSASTSQVWPHVQSYLARSDVGVVLSNADAGLIETDWLTYSDDDSIIARFLISIEKGLHPETTEIHVIEYQAPVGTKLPETMDWPDKSVDVEREEWAVKELASHLAQNISNASASLLGQNVGGEVKAVYVKGATEPTLRVRLSSARAWATLQHSAKQEGFVSWERDEKRGIIFAGFFEDQHKERGFWKTVFTLGMDDKLPEEIDHSLDQALQHLSGQAEVRALFDGVDGVAYGDALEEVVPGYLIVMTPAEGYADVVIRDHRGRMIAVNEAKALLRLLRKNLI